MTTKFMKRAVLASWALGTAVGCSAAMPEQQMYQIPIAHVETPMVCWPADEPLPERFVGMEIMAASLPLRRVVVGRDGMWSLIEEIAPGWVCITSEGAQI
jgi:hypothetical protein